MLYKARFGQSSEKVSGAQLSLFLALMGADDSESDQSPLPDADLWRQDEDLRKYFEDKDKRKQQTRRRGRGPLPKGLPR